MCFSPHAKHQSLLRTKPFIPLRTRYDKEAVRESRQTFEVAAAQLRDESILFSLVKRVYSSESIR